MRGRAPTSSEQDSHDAWREVLRGPTIPCPWNTQSGTRKGEPIETWRCPHCGGLEMSDYMLQINHGTTLAIPNETGCKRTTPYSGADPDGEFAIAAETRSQGQTPPPAEDPDATAATETVKSPSAHTIAKFTAPKHGAVQVVSCTTCGVIGYVKNDGDGYITHADGNPGDIIPWTDGARGGIGRTIHVHGTQDAKAHIQQWHLRDLQLQSSTVLNGEPTAVPGAEPEQPTLDDEALIAQTILACANQIITAIDTAADQAFHHRRGRRDLAQVRILNTTGAMLQQLARDRGLQIARSQGASQANVARALGVTRARVNQMLKNAE